LFHPCHPCNPWFDLREHSYPTVLCTLSFAAFALKCWPFVVGEFDAKIAKSERKEVGLLSFCFIRVIRVHLSCEALAKRVAKQDLRSIFLFPDSVKTPEPFRPGIEQPQYRKLTKKLLTAIADKINSMPIFGELILRSFLRGVGSADSRR